MEIDFEIRKLLTQDENIRRHEAKMQFDFYNCKIDQCQQKESLVGKLGKSNGSFEYKSETYENCIILCGERFNNFINLKQQVYSEFFTQFYKKTSDCGLSSSCQTKVTNEFMSSIKNVKQFLLNH